MAKTKMEADSAREKALSMDREFVTAHQDQAPVGVDISVGQEENSRHQYQCLLRLQPSPQDPTLYTLRLATNIPTFSIKTSCTAR